MKRRNVLAFFISIAMMVTSISPAAVMADEIDAESVEVIEEVGAPVVEKIGGVATEDKVADENKEDVEIIEELVDEEAVDEKDDIEEIKDADDDIEDIKEDEVEVAKENKAILRFDFENLTTPNAEIIGDGAKATGTYSIDKGAKGVGKGLKLNKGESDQFLTVTAEDGSSLVKGLDAITISYDYNLGDAFCVEGWIFTLMAKGNTSQAYGAKTWDTGWHDLWVRNQSGTQDAFGVNIGSAKDVLDTWIHIDYTIDKNGVYRIYKDGKQVNYKTNSNDKVPAVLGDGDTDLYIGKLLHNGINFQGYIDNFTIYNYALSATEVANEYQALLDSLDSDVDSDESKDSLNVGYVAKDFALIETLSENAITSWNVNVESGDGEITFDGNTAKVTRGNKNTEVTLTANTASGSKEFKVIVLADGEDLITYTTKSPIEGQGGGMIVGKKGEDGKYEAIHSNQPILYTAKGSKYFGTPKLFRKADGSLGMIASDKNTNNIIIFDSADGISYTNERYITVDGVSSISNLDMVYDLTDERYELYIKNTKGTTYLATSTDLETFDFGSMGIYEHEFNAAADAPTDANYASEISMTQDEYDNIIKKFTNPQATTVTKNITTSISVNTVDDIDDEIAKLSDNVEIEYTLSDGTTTTRTYGVHYNQDDLNRIKASTKGTYTLRGYLGGDSYIIDADDPLIPERADPFITYDKESGYYFFTSSYPMNGSGDVDGYDRLILRCAKTINELATAEEVVIWDEGTVTNDNFSRFIWAPEIHKIGGSWYFIATASIAKKSSGHDFNIRPFMVKYEETLDSEEDIEDFKDASNWGEPTLVKAKDGDNILNGMSLDMTYFEANGHHYLVWPDETKNDTNPNALSSIYIAEIDSSDPTQLISNAMLLTEPEYSWERVRYNVNEGPAVIKKDGKVYVAFSAAGTGSEYCVGYLVADETADLLNMDNWTKNPYPILTSGDFDDKLSGPGHNSFTINANEEPIIVFHARPADTHANGGGVHTGDPLYDPCRHAYIRPVFFDSQGVPILNISDTEFAGEGGSQFDIEVTINEDNFSTEPILEYNFDEVMDGNTIKDSVGSNDATLKFTGDTTDSGYVQDPKYGQVLYLDGDKSVYGTDSYLEFPEGFFDGRNNLTISMDVNEITKSKNYFTFAIGQDVNKYMFTKVAPTEITAKITKGGSSGEKTATKSNIRPTNVRDWINLKLVLTKDSVSVYRNGVRIADATRTGTSIEDLGESLKAYLGKSFYSSDIEFRGYFDNVKVYEYAMNDDQVLAAYNEDEEARKEKLSQVERVAGLFEIPNADDIRGNITLPSEIDGVSIDWSSSNEAVINTETKPVANYDDMPAGVVTRQAEDTDVTLTATFSKAGQESITNTYDVKVIAKPTIDPMKDYMYVGFRDAEQDITKEQIYFATSKDGFNWVDLNDNKPILTSKLGESGTRDQFIGRSAEGDKFYIVATDLSINNNKNNGAADWGSAGGLGSTSIVMWESEDLVNWSEPWMVEVAPWLDDNDKPGCTWAPEFYYDEKTGEYVVFFSCTHLELDDDGNITQNYENHSVYYCKTRDFRTFTEAKEYIKIKDTYSGGERKKRIDTTMIKDGDTYYRYTKKERPNKTDGGEIYIEKSDSILGTWTEIDSPSLKAARQTYGELEGPSIFKYNEKDENGNDQWCLLIDRFAKGLGYQPFLTTDLSSGEWRGLADGEFSNPSTYRHGSFMPITAKEYAALQEEWGNDENADKITKVEKSNSGNPMLGFDDKGNTIYGGDPSILVDGDTVYAYVGQDVSTDESYNMPDWKCYSSTDMINWKYESTILTCDKTNVKWANDAVSAWAGQVVKYKNKYYFYYCTEANSSNGSGKAIGVAVSDSPKGPFKDIGHPLVKRTDTTPQTNNWDDIDPTFWIETDADGVEHRVLGWGNSRFYNCELNEDMISIKDRDGIEGISCAKASANPKADIKEGVIAGLDGHTYTEAPYYYRQQDENGNYYGNYYMFFATDWREQMAYAYAETFEDFINNEWTFGGVLMEPSATANTNHMAVFDFKGQTYFVYHDGSLPHGSGFRRVACVEPIEINADGSIDYIRKTATGLTGTLSTITNADGDYVAAKSFENTLNDSDYPMINKEIVVDYDMSGYEAGWEINPGKIYKKFDEYVSIESDYKPGMYISAGIKGTDYETGAEDKIPAFLAQDAGGTSDEKMRMTFRTLKGFADEDDGITFESVKYPGFYLAKDTDGSLILAQTPNVSDEAVTFYIKERDVKATDTTVQKTKRTYVVGDTLNDDDIRVIVKENGVITKVEPSATNADEIDMTTAGDKVLTVTYELDGVSIDKTIKIHVMDSEYGR